MPRLPPSPWWTVRRAANRKPATYRCPLCGHHLPALSEHMLIAPEGDSRRRRHAHTACVLAARSRGQLVLREAMSVDSADPTAAYFGTSTAQLFCTRDEGGEWGLLADFPPPIYRVEAFGPGA